MKILSSVRLNSKKTLPILVQALRLLRFSQTELSELTGVSIGRVNKIISWLKHKDVVIKEAGKYVITQPNRVADMIAEQVILPQTRTYYIQSEEADIKKLLKKGKSELCLRSALALHDTKQTSSQIHAIDTPELRNLLDKETRGDRVIQLYDYGSEPQLIESPIRTIIDMRAVGERHRTEALAFEQWGTHQ